MDTYRLARRYVMGLVATILLFTVLYSVGMSAFEGEPRSLLRSLVVVMQTFTTVGYGEDAPWTSPLMNVFVVTMQAASLVLIFSAVPVVIVPLLEQSLARTPSSSREGLSDHVVVCTATTHTESLIDELVDREVPYVIVEPDREVATDLHERDYEVVHGDPKSMETLERVSVGDARAVVSDADDEVDLNVITSAKEVAPEVPVYSIATDEDLAEYHRLAGADRTFLPRKLLGNGIANKVRNTVEVDVDGAATLGEDFGIAEIPVARGSELDGKRLTESGFRDPADPGGPSDRSAKSVVGVWSLGQFHVPPFEDLPLNDQTVLLTAGRPVTLDSVANSAGSSTKTYDRGRVVVAGSGVVGTLVSDALVEDGIDRTVVDIEDGPRVDVQGDVTDEEVLEAAGVDDARTVVLALDDDTVTLVASFVVRDLAPDVEVVARANQTESVPKLYRAGVDYVLALSTVAGRLLATAILDADQSIDLDRGIRLVDRSPGALAGQSLGEAAVRERTGCTVVAIEHRDGRVSADLRDWTDIEPSDRLVVAGTENALDRFDELR